MKRIGPPRGIVLALGALLSLLLFGLQPARAASLQDIFSRHDAASRLRVDHSAWDQLLAKYVVAGKDGLNRVDYKRFKKEGAETLKRYLAELQKVDPARLARPEQLAFWVNLYNALTVDVVLKHYPVKSIRDIRLSSFLVPGPWDAKLVSVNGVQLSLNDIEHEILRPVWRDPRVHYAVNCASVGCPNLQPAAFTGENVEAMLEKGARDYVNSPRGAQVIGVSLVASKIYSWFAADFGGTLESLLSHLRRYAGPELAAALARVTRVARYEYDWSLNDLR